MIHLTEEIRESGLQQALDDRAHDGWQLVSAIPTGVRLPIYNGFFPEPIYRLIFRKEPA